MYQISFNDSITFKPTENIIQRADALSIREYGTPEFSEQEKTYDLNCKRQIWSFLFTFQPFIQQYNKQCDQPIFQSNDFLIQSYNYDPFIINSKSTITLKLTPAGIKLLSEKKISSFEIHNLNFFTMCEIFGTHMYMGNTQIPYTVDNSFTINP